MPWEDKTALSVRNRGDILKARFSDARQEPAAQADPSTEQHQASCVLLSHTCLVKSFGHFSVGLLVFLSSEFFIYPEFKLFIRYPFCNFPPQSVAYLFIFLMSLGRSLGREVI